jgi:hypothetical protein
MGLFHRRPDTLGMKPSSNTLFSFKKKMSFMPRLFRRKMISGKWFRYFPVFGKGKNNDQPENDFRLTKNA